MAFGRSKILYRRARQRTLCYTHRRGKMIRKLTKIQLKDTIVSLDSIMQATLAYDIASRHPRPDSHFQIVRDWVEDSDNDITNILQNKQLCNLNVVASALCLADSLRLSLSKSQPADYNFLFINYVTRDADSIS